MITSIFVDPKEKSILEVDGELLINHIGKSYSIKSKFAVLVYPPTLSAELLKVVEECDYKAAAYDINLPMTFKTHNINELETRKKFISKLELNKSSKVLEVACGTGRDSSLIANELGPNGELHVCDISEKMLGICADKLADLDVNYSAALANAAYLPYPSNYFDALYSFGGLGEFDDVQAFFNEIVRVCKVGARVVVGDESIPPYLRKTYFSKVLSETNSQFLAEVPLSSLPVEAHDLNLEYVINNAFYILSFWVANGEPKANFDFHIPGIRGGTYRTRYEGKLEGVNVETKAKVTRHCLKHNISIHDFLNNAIEHAISGNESD